MHSMYFDHIYPVTIFNFLESPHDLFTPSCPFYSLLCFNSPPRLCSYTSICEAFTGAQSTNQRAHPWRKLLLHALAAIYCQWVLWISCVLPLCWNVNCLCLCHIWWRKQLPWVHGSTGPVMSRPSWHLAPIVSLPSLLECFLNLSRDYVIQKSHLWLGMPQTLRSSLC